MIYIYIYQYEELRLLNYTNWSLNVAHHVKLHEFCFGDTAPWPTTVYHKTDAIVGPELSSTSGQSCSNPSESHRLNRHPLTKENEQRMTNFEKNTFVIGGILGGAVVTCCNYFKLLPPSPTESIDVWIPKLRRPWPRWFFHWLWAHAFACLVGVETATSGAVLFLVARESNGLLSNGLL